MKTRVSIPTCLSHESDYDQLTLPRALPKNDISLKTFFLKESPLRGFFRFLVISSYKYFTTQRFLKPEYLDQKDYVTYFKSIKTRVSIPTCLSHEFDYNQLTLPRALPKNFIFYLHGFP